MVLDTGQFRSRVVLIGDRLCGISQRTLVLVGVTRVWRSRNNFYNLQTVVIYPIAGRTRLISVVVKTHVFVK
jgi:hypothetical protein